jgi:hypothetical protein
MLVEGSLEKKIAAINKATYETDGKKCQMQNIPNPENVSQIDRNSYVPVPLQEERHEANLEAQIGRKSLDELASVSVQEEEAEKLVREQRLEGAEREVTSLTSQHMKEEAQDRLEAKKAKAYEEACRKEEEYLDKMRMSNKVTYDFQSTLSSESAYHQSVSAQDSSAPNTPKKSAGAGNKKKTSGFFFSRK